jgi:hypothetical protein
MLVPAAAEVNRLRSRAGRKRRLNLREKIAEIFRSHFKISPRLRQRVAVNLFHSADRGGP